MRKLFVAFVLLSIIILPFTAKSQGNANPDVIPGYRFKVVFNKQLLFFQEIKDIDLPDRVVVKKSTGSQAFTQKKMPGITKLKSAILKKGVWKNYDRNSNGNALAATIKGTMDIYLLDNEGNPLTHWTFKNARVLKIAATDLPSDDVLIETLTVSLEDVIVN